MSYNLEFTIYNYPLTNVSATDGITTITLGNGINVDMTGNSYRGILVSENDSASITVSANGFFPKTKTISDDVVDSFTLTRINNLYAYTDPNPSSETLYAWTSPNVPALLFGKHNANLKGVLEETGIINPQDLERAYCYPVAIPFSSVGSEEEAEGYILGCIFSDDINLQDTIMNVADFYTYAINNGHVYYWRLCAIDYITNMDTDYVNIIEPYIVEYCEDTSVLTEVYDGQYTYDMAEGKFIDGSDEPYAYPISVYIDCIGSNLLKTYYTDHIPVNGEPSFDLYNHLGEIVRSDGAVYNNTIYLNDEAYISSWDRNSSMDIISQIPATLYTDSTTLTTGMTLYDNTGSDTGLTIGVINQDGSFDLVSSYAFSFDKDNTITNYIIDGVTYTDDATVELADGTHSITVNGTKNHIYIQGYATYTSPGTAISFTVSGSNITLILPNASSNPTFDAATLSYPIQLTTINEPV